MNELDPIYIFLALGVLAVAYFGFFHGKGKKKQQPGSNPPAPGGPKPPAPPPPPEPPIPEEPEPEEPGPVEPPEPEEPGAQEPTGPLHPGDPGWVWPVDRNGRHYGDRGYDPRGDRLGFSPPEPDGACYGEGPFDPENPWIDANRVLHNW